MFSAKGRFSSFGCFQEQSLRQKEDLTQERQESGRGQPRGDQEATCLCGELEVNSEGTLGSSVECASCLVFPGVKKLVLAHSSWACRAGS